MTDQDNLRERIAAAIYKNQDVVVGDAGEIFGDAAQAVIDELGLTTETHAATHSKRAMTRIIGEWEWDN